MRKLRELFNPHIIVAVLAAAIFISTAASALQIDIGKEKNTCKYCHGAVAAKLKESVHAEYGLACVDCHGGDPTAPEKADSMNPAKGFTGKPTALQIPALCSSCHSDYAKMRQYGIPTDQFAAYSTSNHGISLLQKGNKDAAQCVSCHGSHDILKTSDSRSPVYSFNIPKTCGKCHSDKKIIEKYNLKSDAVKEYKKSIHGRRLLKEFDTAAPSCASCHGNHGAAPPGVSEVVNICGKCHSNTRDYFVKSKHYAKGIKCVDCHDNHNIKHPTFALYERNEEGLCAKCHKDEKTAAGKFISGVLRSVKDAKAQINYARADVNKVAADGADVDSKLEMLAEAKSAIIKLGPLQHQTDLRSTQKVLQNEAMIKAHTIQNEVEAYEKEEKDKMILCAAFAGYVCIFIALLYTKFWTLKRRYLKERKERKAGAAA